MNEQNPIIDALARLKAHFGASLLLYPPITSDGSRQLEEIVGKLPSDLAAFLSACNGLRVDIPGRDDVHLWGTSEMLASVVDPGSSIVPRCFLPFRGDPTGERDWIITEFKPALGAIVRWDPWTPKIQLMASTFGHFLSGWVDYLENTFVTTRTGSSVRLQRGFDNQWIKNDLRLAQLKNDPVVTEWLSRIAEAATCDSAACRSASRIQYALCGPMSRKTGASSK